MWDEPTARHHFFFGTAEECCETRFPDGCTIEDYQEVSNEAVTLPTMTTTTTTEATIAVGTIDTNGYTILGPHTIEDFDGAAPTLPFDYYGKPDPQWRLDDTVSYSGTHSITNIPNDGINTKSDLSLKINVQQSSIVKCQAKIDVSLPYEYFTLIVNGQQRNTYTQKLDGWVPVVTSVLAGGNTIVFRVQNHHTEVSDGMMGERLEDHYGSGRVWIDDCEVYNNV